MKNSLLHLVIILSSLSFQINAQQILFVQGNGNGTDANPELSVQGGVLYIQGGLTVTGTAPRVVNSAAIVVDGGDWENISDGELDISSPTNTYFPITGFTDLNTDFPADDLNGGTVHMSSGNQKIKGDFGTRFYNLSLDGTSTNIKLLEGVDVEVSHQLYLNDEIFALNDYTLFVSNPDLGAISRASTGSAGNEPTDLYGNTSIGMGSLNQFSDLNSGMVTATNNGRLKRATSAGEGPYFFPLGTPDNLLYRPMEIVNSSLSTNYSARLEKNTPNPFSFGIPAPTKINNEFYHLINCDGGGTGDEIRIYTLLTELLAINSDCDPTSTITSFGVAQTSNISYSEWIFEEGEGAGPGNGDLYYVHTTQYAANAPDYMIDTGNYREAYAIAFKQLLGFVK